MRSGSSSGTDALLVALMALDVEPGDEVITTAFSFFATAGTIHRVGAIPVFVDIDPATFDLVPEQVAAKVGPKTKAIMPVHLFGQPADMVALRSAAGRPPTHRGRRAGDRWDHGRRTGRWPRGLRVLQLLPLEEPRRIGRRRASSRRNDDDLAELARVVRMHGAKPKYFHGRVGGNFRLDALQAALLAVKLPHLNEWTRLRRENAARYDALFAEAGLAPERLTTPPKVMSGHVYNQYVIRTDRRDALRAHLAEQRIGTTIYYPRGLHRQECFAHLGYAEGSLPECERACAEVLALPIFPTLGAARQERIVRAVVSFLEG